MLLRLLQESRPVQDFRLWHVITSNSIKLFAVRYTRRPNKASHLQNISRSYLYVTKPTIETSSSRQITITKKRYKLSLGIKCSMRDAICDVNYRA